MDHEEDYLGSMVRQVLGTWGAFLIVWLLVELISPRTYLEHTIRIAPGVVLTLPFSIFRFFGPLWFLYYGLMMVSVERRARRRGEDSAEGLIVVYALTLAGLLGGLIVSVISYWTGAWLSLLAVAAVSFSISRDQPPEDGDDLAFGALFFAAATGPWTGLFNGLLHGFVGAVVAFLTPARQVKPVERQLVSGLHD
ncbi:MAG: hypothetical protein HYY50_05005 [Candidatus Kerfeldbacteria bacterium]|nr:hypothetical protein [Candidatus Kerfeldbacteria bacterium]